MAIASWTKDPSAILDYAVDWTDWLSGDTIASSSWTVPAGLTKVTDSFTGLTATVRLSGGTHGSDYEVVNHVITTTGQEDERSIIIEVRSAEETAAVDTLDRTRALLELTEKAQINVAPILTQDEIEDILNRNKRASTWVASTVYKPGDVVMPATKNGRRYRARTGGTSDTTTPFANLVGTELQVIVSDGDDLTWIEDGPEYSNIYDVRQAAYECWRLRQSKAAQYVATGQIAFQQVFEHCGVMMQSFGSLG